MLQNSGASLSLSSGPVDALSLSLDMNRETTHRAEVDRLQRVLHVQREMTDKQLAQKDESIQEYVRLLADAQVEIRKVEQRCRQDVATIQEQVCFY
jgi:hypothetical protein